MTGVQERTTHDDVGWPLLDQPSRHPLAALGWSAALDPWWASARQRMPGLEPGRVVATHRETSIVRLGGAEVAAGVSGRFRLEAFGVGDYPAVGDWVAVDARHAERSGTIHELGPRRSALVRSAGESGRRGGGRLRDEQVLAANVDVALLVAAIDRGPNLARLERYLALAWGSGATPVVVLNKLDVCADVRDALAAAVRAAPGAEVHPVSALTGDGLDALRPHLGPATTLVVLGPSGVGKSSLVNALLGLARQATAPVRASDSRGRHTTTHRELIVLPGGALLIDTPGIRSLELSEGVDGVARAFEDVEALVAACRFSDCRHRTEPGCEVRASLEDGRLDRRRWASFEKLRRETERAARATDPRARAAERQRWKAIHAEVARRMRSKYGEAM